MMICLPAWARERRTAQSPRSMMRRWATIPSKPALNMLRSHQIWWVNESFQTLLHFSIINLSICYSINNPTFRVPFGYWQALCFLVYNANLNLIIRRGWRLTWMNRQNHMVRIQMPISSGGRKLCRESLFRSSILPSKSILCINLPWVMRPCADWASGFLKLHFNILPAV